MKGTARVDAQQVKDRRGQVGRRHSVTSRIGPLAIAGTIDLSRGNAGTGHGKTENRPPVIASARRVDLRRATELADRHHQGLIEQSTRFQVFDQCRESNVELRTQDVLKSISVLGMSVPHRVVDSRITWLPDPVDVHKPHACFDQPSRHQQQLVPVRHPVTPPERLGLTADIKGAANTTVDKNVEGLVLVRPEQLRFTAAPDLGKMTIDLLQQPDPVLQPQRGHILQLQPGHSIPGLHRVHVEPVGVPATAQEAGSLSGRSDVLVEPDNLGEPDRRQRRQFFAGLELLDQGPEPGPVFRTDPTGVGPLVLVAGQDLIPTDGMDVVVGDHRANDGQLVGNPRRSRQQFAEVHAGNIGLDRRELAADARGSQWLGVEGLVLGRPALQPDIDHALGPTEGRIRVLAGTAGGRSEQTGQRESQAGETSHPDHLSTIQPVTHPPRVAFQRPHCRPFLPSVSPCTVRVPDR